MASTRKPVIFMAISLVVLFAPGVGEIRWGGLIAFLYIGLPWYILSVKDKLESKSSEEKDTDHRFRIRSLTLLIFGLICAIIGVAVDLFILHQVYTDASVASVGSVMLRLFIGFPFFCFGAYLLYLSLGFVRNET